MVFFLRNFGREAETVLVIVASSAMLHDIASNGAGLYHVSFSGEVCCNLIEGEAFVFVAIVFDDIHGLAVYFTVRSVNPFAFSH